MQQQTLSQHGITSSQHHITSRDLTSHPDITSRFPISYYQVVCLVQATMHQSMPECTAYENAPMHACKPGCIAMTCTITRAKSPVPYVGLLRSTRATPVVFRTSHDHASRACMQMRGTTTLHYPCIYPRSTPGLHKGTYGACMSSIVYANDAFLCGSMHMCMRSPLPACLCVTAWHAHVHA